MRDAAWHLQSGESLVVAKCVTILRRHDLAVLAEAIQTTHVTPAVAATVAAEFDKISQDLADGAGHGSRPRPTIGPSTGWMVHSKPQPEPDGEPDLRPVGGRPAGALIEVCRRCTAAGGQVPSAAKAALYVTMTYEELQKAIGAATTIGSLDNGSLLAPETARKLACDAQIIPVVSGSDGEILDEGRAQRLFTAAQLKALWLRDRHCRFPGCEAPAHWCDAHHLIHWIDWGPTDLDNGALLCGRHPLSGPAVSSRLERGGPEQMNTTKLWHTAGHRPPAPSPRPTSRAR